MRVILQYLILSLNFIQIFPIANTCSMKQVVDGKAHTRTIQRHLQVKIRKKVVKGDLYSFIVHFVCMT